MGVKARQLFYGLSIFLLMTVFFVLQPSKVPQVVSWQEGIKQQFSVAWQQTIGDGPYFETVGNLYDDIAAFYDRSSEAAISLLSQPESDQAIYYVFHTTYQDFAQIFQTKHVHLAINLDLPMPENFMTEAAMDNIIPDSPIATKALFGSVAGALINSDEEPVNKTNSWVTIRDNYTGQKYCLAVYNGTVNKYLGVCKSEYR